MSRSTQTNDSFFNRFDRLAGLNGGRTGQAAHTSAGGFFTAEKGIGIGKGFLFHNADFNTFSSIKP
jgi:hypothetical protein